MLLRGKTAIVTGAASIRGIGFATARLFADHGARVALVDIQEDAVVAAAAKLGADHAGFACDVSDEGAVAKLKAVLLGAFGQIDVVVNNAAIFSPSPTLDIDAARWNRTLAVNLGGVFTVTRAFLPEMVSRRSGAVVCVSSVAAQRGGGIFSSSDYAASKAGILGFAKSIAREYAPLGIRVNCVTPGLIDTDILVGNISKEAMAESVAAIPLRRAGRPQDVAGACLFLASELSAYTTGAVVDVNGGAFIH